MAEYRLTPAAQQDLDEIVERSVAEWGLPVALSHAEDLEAALAMPAESPQRGRRRVTIRPSYRRLGVGSHVICYKAPGTGSL